MTIDNTPVPSASSGTGRLAAIVCAAALGAGGTTLLFGDVIFGDAAFTQKHFQTITIVIATTMAWMATTAAFKKRHIIAGFGFLILALAGSGVIVWNSLGRQTEGQMLSADDHDKAVEKRGDLSKKKAAAEETLAQRQKEADKACKKYPDGRTCRGAIAVVTFWAENVAGLQAQLDVLKVKPADPSAEALGNLANALGRNGTKAKALSMLVMPYFITILFEFGFTMSLHYAFRPFAPTRAAATPTLRAWGPEKAVTTPTALGSVSDTELSSLREQFAEPSPAPNGSDKDGGATVRKPNGSPKPSGPNGSPNRRNRPSRGGFTKDEAIADLLTRLALGERFGSQDELANRYTGGVKSTMSEWIREWERSGLVPARTQRGRCKALENA